jgi:hypothetical protein
MRKLMQAMTAFLAASLAAGCASTPAAPEVMRDAGADFGAYRTYGWFQPPQDDKASPTRSIVDGYVRSAIANEMKAKGYAEAAAGAAPDLVIEYAAASSEKLKNNPFRIGVGVGSYGSNAGGSVGVGSPSVREVKEGSLVVHVIDHAREAEVWRGSIERELGKGGVDQAVVQAAVTELMRDFPARGTQP